MVGFVLAAVIAVVLWASGVVDDSDGSAGGSTDSISLPARAGDYVSFGDAKLNQQARAQKTVANRAADDSATAKAVSAAYDGAGAAVRTYTDQKLETIFSVWAVRASTPDPVVYIVPPEQIGLAQAQSTIARYGSVVCQLATVVSTPAGKTPPPDSQAAVLCQRSEGNLTVGVHGGTTSGIFSTPAKVAALVDTVWDQVS